MSNIKMHLGGRDVELVPYEYPGMIHITSDGEVTVTKDSHTGESDTED